MASRTIQLQLTNVPGTVDDPGNGGAGFFVYCAGAEARARQRRLSAQSARAMHRRTTRSGSRYPTALVWMQRLGVAVEDLIRLVIGLENLTASDDALDAFRNARYDDLDSCAQRLRDKAQFRRAVRLPDAADVRACELTPGQQDSLLAAAEVALTRWHPQFARCADGWLLVRTLAKAGRHGTPLIPRETVIELPGAGALGRDSVDVHERWVLVTSTESDELTRHAHTSYVPADVSDATLTRAHEAALEGIALTRALAEGHVHRVRTASKWVLPNDVVRKLPASGRSAMRQARR